MNWTIGDLMQVVAFVVLPALGAAASWFSLRSPRFDRLPHSRWILLAVSAFLLTRVGMHALVFGVFRYPGGNDLRAWEDVAQLVLAGDDPNSVLSNHYGPLLPYVFALGYLAGGCGHPSSIDVPFVLADGILLWILFRIARGSLGVALARRLTLSTMLVPLLWHGEVVRTQEESLIALFLIAVLALLLAGREAPACFVAALGTLATKALFPLWVLPVLLAPGPTRGRAMLRTCVAGGLTVLGYGVAILLGWQYRSVPGRTPKFSGSSPWVLAEMAGLRESPGLVLAVALAAAFVCAAVALVALRRAEDSRITEDRAAAGVTAVTAAFFLLSPMGLAAYIVQGLPFLLWWFVREGAASERWHSRASLTFGAFLGWNVLAVGFTSDRWQGQPWLLPPFAAFWLLVLVLAVRRPPVPASGSAVR